MIRFWKHILAWAVFSALWGTFVFYLYADAQKDHQSGLRQQALAEAKMAWSRDLHSRRWAARMGGLYARITDEIRPNPYLRVPDRDVTTTDGDRLTLINPAYMARLIHELMAEETDHRAHITSLDPVRPGNAPDEWETRVLKRFKTGDDEFY